MRGVRGRPNAAPMPRGSPGFHERSGPVSASRRHQPAGGHLLRLVRKQRRGVRRIPASEKGENRRRCRIIHARRAPFRANCALPQTARRAFCIVFAHRSPGDSPHCRTGSRRRIADGALGRLRHNSPRGDRPWFSCRPSISWRRSTSRGGSPAAADIERADDRHFGIAERRRAALGSDRALVEAVERRKDHPRDPKPRSPKGSGGTVITPSTSFARKEMRCRIVAQNRCRAASSQGRASRRNSAGGSNRASGATGSKKAGNSRQPKHGCCTH